jgi:hypothetical protein
MKKTDVHEFINYLIFEGEEEEVRDFDLLIPPFQPYLTGPAKDRLLECLSPTPIQYLSSRYITNPAPAAEYRKKAWGTSTDAYCVSLSTPDNGIRVFRFKTKGCPPIPVVETITTAYSLNAKLTYFSEEARVAGAELWEGGENVESLRFENDGYETLLYRFLVQGANPYDYNADIIEYQRFPEGFVVGFNTPNGPSSVYVN